MTSDVSRFYGKACMELGITNWRVTNGILNYQHNTIELSTIEQKAQFFLDQEPIRLLRIERNKLLAETDWRMVKDYKGTDQSSWETYRQALRDLPATAEPQLDSQGNLTNVDWPSCPENN
tara:strand:+ start:692 stop:1051 length:360 start_codon:yes stop_codon:yes gene_type:complete